MQNPTITIEQARNILKEKGGKMTDKEIADLLATLRLVCSKILDNVLITKND